MEKPWKSIGQHMYNHSKLNPKMLTAACCKDGLNAEVNISRMYLSAYDNCNEM